MKPSSGAITIASSAPLVDVDNRLSLRVYYRIANNLLLKADVYRSEKNIIDLYVMLLRFSSLINETIPRHKDYQLYLSNEKLYYKKRLLSAITELENLKPEVRQRLSELNRKSRIQVNQGGLPQQVGDLDDSLAWPPVKNQTPKKNNLHQGQRTIRQNGFNRTPVPPGDNQSFKIKEDQFRKLYLRPKDETLSRHSILGPHGLHGPWQPHTVNHAVQYPSNLDLTPVVIPSLLRPTEDTNKSDSLKNEQTLEKEKSTLEEVLSLSDGLRLQEESRQMTDLDVIESLSKVDLAKELTPPPVLAEVQDIAVMPEVPNTLSEQTISLQDELVKPETPLEVHISTTLMDTFMRLAKSNTNRNLETCGVLAGSLKNKKFYVTALIIPKQESTSDSCQTTNEEEIFEYQDKQSLFPLGWIHTHPTQSCFMSSIDVHTHFSYQIMLPEAIAIVMAPRGGARTHGIFRLTTPGGMSVIRQCPHRGFHPHKEPEDGSPIYDHCSDVYMSPNLKFDVVDLR